MREGQPLLAALQAFDWLDRITPLQYRPESLRFVIESDSGFMQLPDWPQTFDTEKRFYLPRHVEIRYLPVPAIRYEEMQ